MTLVISIQSRAFSCQVSDRRLNLSGRPIDYLATKAFRIDTEDSQSILGYSGIGATGASSDREISHWLKRVTRGYSLNYTTLIDLIRQASQRRIHVDQHVFSIVGFVGGTGMMTHIFKGGSLFAQSLGAGNELSSVFDSDHAREFMAANMAVEAGIALSVVGSGDRWVVPHLKSRILRLANSAIKSQNKASFRQKIDNLAAYSAYVIRLVSRVETTVGPEATSSVILSDRRGGWSKAYDRSGFTLQDFVLPTVAGSIPVDDVFRVFGPYMFELLSQQSEKTDGSPKQRIVIDEDRIQSLLNTVQSKPTDSL